MVKNSKGVSLIALIITIIVTIMLASISYVVNTDALNSSVEIATIK